MPYYLVGGAVRKGDGVAVSMASIEEPMVENGSKEDTTSSSSSIDKIRCSLLMKFLVNIKHVLFGTKISLLFPAILFAVVAHSFHFGEPWVFGLSLIGLVPLAERVSFLTEQLAHYTNPTVGGLLNATCGNVPELIIALFALKQHKIDVIKYSLFGSILSNLLLVLGISLFTCGIANLSKNQTFQTIHAHVNIQLLLVALVCHTLALLVGIGGGSSSEMVQLSRASSIVMLVAYIVYLVFQLYTHRQWFKLPEEAEDSLEEMETETETTAMIGFWNAIVWLIGMAALIALLSEYAVGTIEDASESWGLSVRFISIILLPTVGNAAEHVGAIVFALKNRLDICLSINLGSATQIAIFVMPFCVVVAWIIGVNMDLNLNILETGSLALSIMATTFTLQDGTSHYLKGLTLILCYFVIGSCFFVTKIP